MQTHLPVDFPKVLADIAFLLGDEVPTGERREPVGTRTVADYLGVNRSTMLRWIAGSEPSHSDGETMLTAWCKLSGKAREFVPRGRPARPSQVRQAAAPEVVEAETADDSVSALTAIAAGWGRAGA